MLYNKNPLNILFLLIFIASCSNGVVTGENTKLNEDFSKIESPLIVSEKTDSIPIDIIKPNEGPNTIGTKPEPATVEPAPTMSTFPKGDTGTTSDIKERATFNGRVYDSKMNPVHGAIVTAKSVDAGVSWIGEATQTQQGAYVFRNAPVGARIEVSVSKDGWTTRTRSEVLKSNINGDPKANTFDFGFDGSTGSTDPNSLYAIQDEPEIISLKINGKLASDSALGCPNKTESSGNPDFDVNNNPLLASTTGVTTDIFSVEMIFSEVVNKDDVQNYFRIVSTVGDAINSKGSFKGALSNQKTIIIDKNHQNVSFNWSSDGKRVIFKADKTLLANVGSNVIEARYLIDFSTPFKDLTLVKADPKRTFRFTASKLGGFHIFSTKNQ